MDEQAARELEVVSHEMRTFLREDVERICREAMEMVNEVSMHLKCTELYKDKDGGLVAAEEGSMLFLESDDKTVVGSLRISDCHVHDFDVNVRFPKYNKGGNMQFTIAHKFTYTLRQIQDALHYIERAGGMLVHLPHLEGAGDPTWRELLPYMRKITKVCSDIVELLLKAVTELNDWSTRALPSLPQNWLRMEPALPSDLLLQMYLRGSTLTLRVCILAMHAKCPSNKAEATVGDCCGKLKGRIMPHKGGWIEVLEAVDARCSVGTLKQGIEKIHILAGRFRDLKRNAEAMEAAVAREAYSA